MCAQGPPADVELAVVGGALQEHEVGVRVGLEAVEPVEWIKFNFIICGKFVFLKINLEFDFMVRGMSILGTERR